MDKAEATRAALGQVVELPGLKAEPQGAELFERVPDDYARRERAPEQDHVLLLGNLCALTGGAKG